MKIKNATIKDFDTAYEYIKKLWDYNTYDYETTKEVYEKVLQDENSFAFLAIEDDGTFHGFCHGDYFQTFWMSGLTISLGKVTIITLKQVMWLMLPYLMPEHKK